MNEERAEGLFGLRRVASGFARSRRSQGKGEAAPDEATRPAPAQEPDATAPDAADSTQKRRSDLAMELAEVQAATRRMSAELEEVTTERDRLRGERLSVQELLGEQHDKRVLPRLRVEKTNGTPSFVVGARMMQRVHRRALDPAAGLDGVGAVFADPRATARFARSHGVPVLEDGGNRGEDRTAPIIVHAFKGEVGLVEVRGAGGVRHFDESGSDAGDIRPSAPYDGQLARPEAFADLCSRSTVLSAAIPRPYVQLYWSAEGQTAMLEHIDPDPDRIPVLTPEWDQRLGSAFDRAYARFLLQPYRAGGLANRVPGGTFTYKERQ